MFSCDIYCYLIKWKKLVLFTSDSIHPDIESIKLLQISVIQTCLFP